MYNPRLDSIDKQCAIQFAIIPQAVAVALEAVTSHAPAMPLQPLLIVLLNLNKVCLPT
jgi:hypothetical protein